MRSAALLDSLLDGERRERAHHRSHRLSSEVIRSRSVLLKCKPNEGEGEPLEDVSETKVGSTTTQAILNLVIATAGGIGMVTLPGVFSVVGYLEGILLLVTSGVCAAISLALLNSACDARKEASSSYGALVAASLGVHVDPFSSYFFFSNTSLTHSRSLSFLFSLISRTFW